MNKTVPTRTAFYQEGAVNLRVEAFYRYRTQTIHEGFVASDGERLLLEITDDKAEHSLLPTYG